MADWKTTFDIRDVWSKRNGECGREEWTDRNVHELAKEIARRIKRKWSQKMIEGSDIDCDLVDVYDHFQFVPTYRIWEDDITRLLEDENVDDDEIRWRRDNPPLKEFNNVMGEFYDWCDKNLVWIDK